jgi:hypothetical protein
VTDRELATALLDAINLERAVRRATPAAAEHATTREVLRQTVALRKSLERFISARMVRAQGMTTI